MKEKQAYLQDLQKRTGSMHTRIGRIANAFCMAYVGIVCSGLTGYGLYNMVYGINKFDYKDEDD